jgi:hypothetical protein
MQFVQRIKHGTLLLYGHMSVSSNVSNTGTTNNVFAQKLSKAYKPAQQAAAR